MTRHDQYGTHDETRGPARRSGAQRRGEEQAAHETKADPRGKTPNYGNAHERAARTTGGTPDGGKGASFEGRDFEREGYGGGYGVQRKTRDVPAAGRKGEWMQDARRTGRRGRG
jgi:hypothetical protein